MFARFRLWLARRILPKDVGVIVLYPEHQDPELRETLQELWRNYLKEKEAVLGRYQPMVLKFQQTEEMASEEV